MDVVHWKGSVFNPQYWVAGEEGRHDSDILMFLIGPGQKGEKEKMILAGLMEMARK